MAIVKVAGFDPSLRNWGIAIGTYNTELLTLEVQSIDICQPDTLTGKQVRQNSKDLHKAEQLTAKAVEAARGVNVTFVEVPVGSQSARAMCSYGICVGILGALRAGGIPFIEVTPTEVKTATNQPKTASKEDMIHWATANHPNVNWPIYKRKGELILTKSIAEHQADAIAAIYAGIKTPAFQQLLAMYN